MSIGHKWSTATNSAWMKRELSSSASLMDRIRTGMVLPHLMDLVSENGENEELDTQLERNRFKLINPFFERVSREMLNTDLETPGRTNTLQVLVNIKGINVDCLEDAVRKLRFQKTLLSRVGRSRAKNTRLA